MKKVIDFRRSVWYTGAVSFAAFFLFMAFFAGGLWVLTWESMGDENLTYKWTAFGCFYAFLAIALGVIIYELHLAWDDISEIIKGMMND